MMNNEIDNYGYIPSVIDEDEHYILGDGFLQASILMPDGHGWGAYLPDDEIQNRNGLETENCTAYGTLHALATLGNYKKKIGLFPTFQPNLSERYIGIMAGTTIYGNDPHKVIETIRTQCGVIPEAFLQFDNTIDSWMKYYSPRPMTYWAYATGIHWLKKYKVGHDWVFLPTDSLQAKQTKMKSALLYSPLGVAGYAWSYHGDGLYYNDGPANHWFTVYDYVDGVKWLAFDSYNNTHKELAWNYNFAQAKRYSLEFNISGAVLGDQPQSAYLQYGFYLLGQYFGSIMK